MLLVYTANIQNSLLVASEKLTNN